LEKGGEDDDAGQVLIMGDKRKWFRMLIDSNASTIQDAPLTRIASTLD
jgi:hypothetical protein